MGKFIELTDIMGHKLWVNVSNIIYIINGQIKMINDKFINVKESAEEILKLINE